jgi:aminoglycoside/choline kinase family phosphotransferase
VTAREKLITGFLAAAGWPGVTPTPLAADASFRRYFRVLRNGESAVLMDAPPPQENLRAFHRVQRLLLDLGLSAPRPIEVDEAAGLMLLEDLGDRTFTRALAEGAAEAELYRLAVDLLIELHRRFTPDRAAAGALPPYDDDRLLDEALLLTDWYLPALGHAPSAETRDGYVAAWRQVLPVARRVPDSLVLRDYHVDNLMQIEGRRGVASCGLLDFQDAVLGPVSYDLVSLLEDVRRDVSPDLVTEMRARYLAGFPELDPADFGASYAILGAQRNAKIVGIFTRLCRRDGKPYYLGHIPRTWRLLEGDLAHPALAPVRAWFDREIPPARRGVPVAELPA